MRYIFTSFLVVGFALQARAIGECDLLWLKLGRLIKMPQQITSVELEVATSPAILNIITTKSGTIKELLDGKVLSSDLLKRLRARLGKSRVLEELSWDKLNLDEKKLVLEDISKYKIATSRFFSDRAVPFMKVKPEIDLQFKEAGTFLGKEYPKGIHRVNVEGSLNQLEFGNHEQKANALEIHLHVKTSSGEAVRDAWTLERGLNLNPTHLHAHIVAPLPIAEIKANPLLEVTRQVEYHSRVNIVSEMASIVEEGSSISPVVHDGVNYFGNLKRSDLHDIGSYLFDMSKGKLNASGDAKLAWVGYRDHTTYSSDVLLHGSDFRAISVPSGTMTEGNYVKLADSVQAGFWSRDFGISKESISEWLKIQKVTSEGGVVKAVQKTYWDSSLSELISQANPKVKKMISNWLKPIDSLKMTKNLKQESQEIKMLVYDWTSHPLLFQNPALRGTLLRTELFLLSVCFEVRSDHG